MSDKEYYFTLFIKMTKTSPQVSGYINRVIRVRKYLHPFFFKDSFKQVPGPYCLLLFII